MSIKQRKTLLSLLCSTGLAMTGCGTDSGSNEDQINAAADSGILINASDSSDYAYFNIATLSEVSLTEAEAASSTDWDIAFRRTSIILNSGASGPGNVQGAVADSQDDYYDAGGDPIPSVFLNTSADQELPAFQSVDATLADGLTFTSDNNQAAINNSGVAANGSWFDYDFTTHVISANADAWYYVRSADGNAFAKIHVTDIDQPGKIITVEMYIQGTSDSAFDTTATTWVADIDNAGGSLCYDFDTEAEADCTTDSTVWDLMIEISGFSWTVWTNGGVMGDGSAGAAIGSLTQTEADATTDAGTIPGVVWVADAPAGVFINNTWYAYSLQGMHKLWPNYRVYVIDTGAGRYKMQVLSYYHPDTADSGYYTIRAEQID